MTTKKKSRLGRGLGGLISGGVAGEPAVRPAALPPQGPRGENRGDGGTASATSKPADAEFFVQVPAGKIEPSPYQARRDIDEEHIRELADSIRSEGLLQPIVVRQNGEKYELIAGERRWRACKSLNMEKVPARVIQASNASAAVMSMIENLQREQLNPIEEAFGYASLIRDFDLKQEAVAERVGKARASVANTLRLLHLDGEIQGYVARGLLSAGHAKVLLGVEDPAQRLLLARRALEQGLSVRELEKLVKQTRSADGPSRKPEKEEQETTVIRDLEHLTAKHFGTKVEFKHSPKKGRITIEYYGDDDLHRILEQMGISS